MDDDWEYGTVLRRMITRNPVQYTRVMYLGPGRMPGRALIDKTRFTGLQLTELPPPAVGHWIDPPPVGLIRPFLQRTRYERDPDAD